MTKQTTRPMLPSINNTQLLWVTLIYCYIGIGMMSFTVTATPSLDSSIMAQQIENFISDIMECTGVPPALSVAVVKDGHVILSNGYGITSIDNPSPVTSETKFAIGSLTKAFTAYLMANFVDKSESVNFDTPIKDFIPGFRLVDDYRSNHASLRDILGHRIALPENDMAVVLGIDPTVSRKEFAQKLQYLTTPYSFREKGIYNNYMYILAGDILEKLYNGRSWESQIRSNIFAPLEMTQSGFVDELTQEEFEYGFALPVDYQDGNLTDIDPVIFKIGHVAGAAGTIYSTADDMAKWMNFLLSNGSKTIATPPGFDLDPKLVAMTFEPSIRFFPRGTYNMYLPQSPISHQQNDYSMGWMTSIYREYRKVFHTGGIITHSSRLWLFPDANVGIYLAVNGPASKAKKITSALPYYASDLLLGLQPWFNESHICTDDRLPWERPVLKEVKKKEKSNATPRKKSKPITPTKCDPLDYVGTYSHIVFGDLTINMIDYSKNSSNTSVTEEPYILDFKYGRFGWAKLIPITKTYLTGRFYGPYWYFNLDTNLNLFKVHFSLGDSVEGGCKNLTSLSFGYYPGEFIGPFKKQTAETNSATKIDVLSWSLVLCLVICLDYLFHF